MLDDRSSVFHQGDNNGLDIYRYCICEINTGGNFLLRRCATDQTETREIVHFYQDTNLLHIPVSYIIRSASYDTVSTCVRYLCTNATNKS